MQNVRSKLYETVSFSHHRFSQYLRASWAGVDGTESLKTKICIQTCSNPVNVPELSLVPEVQCLRAEYDESDLWLTGEVTQ